MVLLFINVKFKGVTVLEVKISRLEEEEAKITYQESGGIAIITIHRPQKRNALSQKMWKKLYVLAEKAVKNTKNKVLLLRGSGRHFTSGSDLYEFNKMSVEEAEEAFKVMEQTITYFELLPMPTLCVINGPAMGAGLELALACDMRIGSENTKLGIPVGNLGITLNNRFAHRLVSLLGPSKTKELVYMGKIYDGTQAHQHGLLNELVDSNDLNTHSLNMASRIASQSPRSLLAIKRAVAESTESAPELWEGTTNFVDPEDFPEGVSAFVEKRKPQFKPR